MNIKQLLLSLLPAPAYALKPRAFFDISHWETVPDWGKVQLPDGTVGLITKATEGKGFVDPTFATYFPAFARFPVFRGAYHFFRPDDVAGQVDLFCKTVLAAGYKDGDVLVLDEEYIPSANIVKRLLAWVFPKLRARLLPQVMGDELAHQVWYWLQEVEARLGTRPIIYWSKNTSYYLLDSLGRPPAWVNDYWHWVAWYPDGAYVDGNSWVPASKLPYGVRPDRVCGWQYAANWVLTGVPYDGVDVNTANQAWLDTLKTPTPPPSDGGNMNFPTYGIIRHRPDYEPTWPESVEPGKYYPETVPLSDAGAGDNKGHTLPILPALWSYIQKINDAAGYKYARSVHMMWINKDYNESDPSDVPVAESIRNSHNVIRIIGETATHWKVAAFPHTEDLFKNFDPAKHNWYTMPDLFWLAIAADDKDRHSLVGNGVICQLPSLRYGDGDAWIPKSRVEAFPALPFTAVVTARSLNIRKTYSTQSPLVDGPRAAYAAGDLVIIKQYKVRGADVWGQTDDGWICLRYAQVRGYLAHYTTWKLDTAPVIVPQPYQEPALDPSDVPPPPPAPFKRYIQKVEVTWVIDADGNTEVQVVE